MLKLDWTYLQPWKFGVGKGSHHYNFKVYLSWGHGCFRASGPCTRAVSPLRFSPGHGATRGLLRAIRVSLVDANCRLWMLATPWRLLPALAEIRSHCLHHGHSYTSISSPQTQHHIFCSHPELAPILCGPSMLAAVLLHARLLHHVYIQPCGDSHANHKQRWQ